MAIAPAETAAASARAVTLRLLDALFAGVCPPDVAVRLWDGTTWPPGDHGPARHRCVIALCQPGALRAMFWPPSDLSLGEAYVYGDIDIEGDIHAVFPLAEQLLTRRHAAGEKLRLGRLLLRLPAQHPRPRDQRTARLHGARHSIVRDRQAVAFHYNVSNDFYALWLDRNLVYSCAYFADPDGDLDAAQEQKLDHICRKLRLRPGERLLDIGCGWGGLVMRAAARYGVEAVGVTLSAPQAEFANARIRALGLGERCRVEVRDYREIAAAAPFDKLVSVGMVEHVGVARLPEYFGRAWALLRPGGDFLNHGIARNCGGDDPRPHGPTFVERHVFPDGELTPIHAMLGAAERAGFEVRDVESLREHYARTLRQWVARLEGRHDEAARLTDEATYRVWRLYMAGSAYAFERGRLNIYQSLLRKPDGGTRAPETRADWYA